MKTSRFFRYAVLCSLLTLPVAVADNHEETASFVLPDGNKLTRQIEALKQDPQLVVGKLDNGLTYYIRPCAEPKGRMSVRLRVGTGALSETDEEQGMAHFIEHLEFNGSRTFKRGDVVLEMQRHGLGLGGDANAYTSFDETVYIIDVPNLEEKTVDLTFTIMRDFCDGALMEDSAIEAERGIIESEYKARDSAGYRALKETFGFLFKGSTIPERFPIGTLDFIRNGKPELFTNFYKKHYVPSNMQLIVSGDVPVEQVKAWIEQYFKDMKPAEYDFKLDTGTLSEPEKQDALWIYNKELSSTSLELCMIRKYEEKKDSAAQRVEDMPLQVALAMLNKRFSRMTDKEDCPFLSAGMGQQVFFNQVDAMFLSAATAHENWEKSLQSIEQEVRRAIKYGFTESELDEIGKSLINSYEVQCKNWPTVKSNTMAEAISQSIENREVFTDPFEDLRLVRECMDLLKQNPELCRLALEKEWAPDSIKAVVSSNVENKDGRARILECLKESRQVEVEALKMEELKPFAYENVGAPGKVTSTTYIDDLDITQYVLSNGVRVNVKPTEFNKGTISVKFSIDGGRVASPVDQPGIIHLASAVINGGGLEDHSEEDLKRLMAGRSVGVGFSIGNERFNLSGGTTQKDLELQLKLMIAYAMHPGYRPEAEMRFRRSLPLAYKGMEHSPDGALSLKGMDFLLNGNPVLVMPTQEEVEKRTTADVKAWLDTYLKTGYLEVSVVGDFDKDEIIPVLERTVGAMPARPEKPAAVNHKDLTVKMADMGQTKDIEYPSEIDRTYVCVVWKTKDGFDRQYGRKINLVQAILKQRLFKGIREKMGEAYSSMVRSELSMTYPDLGYIMAICPGVLKNREAVTNAINEITSDLANGTVDADELERARLPLISGMERDLRSNGYWMSVISNSQAEPEDITMARNRIESYKKMTLDEINSLIKEVFKSGNSLNMNILPDVKEAGGEEKINRETKEAA